MKIYIALKWFYEGDGELINEFIDVYASEGKLREATKDKYSFNENSLRKEGYIPDKQYPNLFYKKGRDHFKVYKEVEYIYNTDELDYEGTYGGAFVIQIIEKEL